jgi:hypothetical protein
MVRIFSILRVSEALYECIITKSLRLDWKTYMIIGKTNQRLYFKAKSVEHFANFTDKKVNNTNNLALNRS